MKILVTGNCGFIGQNFVRMYKDEHEIIGFDAKLYAHDWRAASLCRTMTGDISNKNHLDFLFNNVGPFDAIVNFAAESHVDNSIKSPRPFINNFLGTFELLEKFRKYNHGRFLQVSTDEVLGDLKKDDLPFSNSYELKPSSPYSASKASSDLLTLSYARTYNINVVITRSCNNYGRFQYKEKLLPVIILNALKNKQIPVYGTGENQREWIYVEDNCEGIMSALIHGKSSGIYNLGSGIEITNLDLVKKILDIMGKPHSLISFVEDRKGHDFRYFMDSSISNKELNWNARTSLEIGLEKTINWFTSNPNYWEI